MWCVVWASIGAAYPMPPVEKIATGVFVARFRDGRCDTVLTHVTGVETIRLGSALATMAAHVSTITLTPESS